MFPVEIAYLTEPAGDYVKAAVQTVIDIHMQVCYMNFDHDDRDCLHASPSVGTQGRHSRVFDRSGRD